MKETIISEVEKPYHNKKEWLWSEILPGLWQGGTHPEDRVNRGNLRRITKLDFHSVFTMASNSNPTTNGVREFRFAIRDYDMSDFNPEKDLYPLVVMAHNDWRAGRKTLVRCVAGWNRSGLVTALVLIRDGFTPEGAIELIRNKRSPKALSNEIFAEWLLNVDVEFWRK
jgi:protein-tyrosine phosphatase